MLAAVVKATEASIQHQRVPGLGNDGGGAEVTEVTIET